ncbi:MAG: alpha-glucosidase [Treponema sp.]|nr:alpha-glucosidase [Treponema sp.]
MVYRFSYGTIVETNAVVKTIKVDSGIPGFGTVASGNPFKWDYTMGPDDIIYGLGENMRGMNKRGFKYVSWCSDQSNQNESTESLYGAHNFMLITGKETFGVFFDTPSRITFDAGWTVPDLLSVTGSATGVDFYVITPRREDTPELTDIVSQFRDLIGRSYIPPRWAFGFQQSRWGYRTADDVREVVQKFHNERIPLDSICLDIDYMQDYEDFTVDETKFPHMKQFAEELKTDGIHLVPIIDAGVKIKKGYDVYEEGMAHNYFCTKKDGSAYAAGVWPGRSHFPDFLDPGVRNWFGAKYENLTSLGIEGFWNDMNEPAMFYSDESLAETFGKIKTFEGKNLDIISFFDFTGLAGSTFNRLDDYQRFYNKTPMKDGSTGMLRHDYVHNMYGAHMTRAAAEGLQKLSPDKRMLLYSRASCIGAHRYGGIWTGDNTSWWIHLKQEIQMMCGLNMCGFLYSGADIGGFGADTSRDLVLRWTEFGIFTPLMRNHSAWNTRRQECYQYEHIEDFRSVMNLRYSLIPFIYSEFVKAALTDSMYFRPLAFDYPSDERARRTEDELLLGESLLIAPVYEQNATGRYVYLPEDMIQVTWQNEKAVQQNIAKGDHYINVPLNAVVFFVKHDHLIPLCRPALSSDKLDTSEFTFLGDGSSYNLYEDDGYTRDVKIEGSIRKITK